MKLLLKILLILPVTTYGMDYYDAEKIYVFDKNPASKVKIYFQDASEELQGELSKKIYKIVTDKRVIVSSVKPKDGTGSFYFSKEIPKKEKEKVLFALDLKYEVSDVKVPKWNEMKKDVENEKKIISELLLHKNKFKEKTVGEFELEIFYDGRNTKITQDGKWKKLSVGIWPRKNYLTYQKALADEDYKKANSLSNVLNSFEVLIYNGNVVKILLNSIEGGSSTIDFVGSLEINNKQYALIRERNFYDDRREFTYLYEVDIENVGKKIKPSLPVGVKDDEGC